MFHVKQLLRNKLSIPEDLSVDIICGKRILNDLWTLKQVWLSQWTAEKVRLLVLDGASVRTNIVACTFERMSVSLALGDDTVYCILYLSISI